MISEAAGDGQGTPSETIEGAALLGVFLAAVVEAMAAHDLHLIHMAIDHIDPSNANHRHISQFLRAIEERRLLSKIAGSEDRSSQPTIPAPRL